MDSIIILTAKTLGWLVLVAAGLALLAFIFAKAWNMYRSIVGWGIVSSAILEYRRTHPEKFKHFDETKLG